MHKTAYSVLVIACLLISSLVHAQSTEENQSPYLKKFTLVETPSYITYRGGIGNIGNLVYEANLSPEFRTWSRKHPDFGFVFTGNILLRMYDQFSHPVSTPSYMPKGTIFYHLPKPEVLNDQFVFLTFGHHSNGQDGLLLQSDSVSLNTANGSFALNYFSGGFEQCSNSTKRFDPFSSWRITAQYQMIHDPRLRNMYGNIRLYAALRSTYALPFELRNLFSGDKTRPLITGLLNLTWIGNGLDDTPAIDIKRLIFSYSLSYQPAFLRDIELFARYYHGQDYYNIQFQRMLNVVQFGVSIRNLHF